MAKTAREVLEKEFLTKPAQPAKKTKTMNAKRTVSTVKPTKMMSASRFSGPVQGERYDAPVTATKPAAKSRGTWTQAQKEQAMRERRAAAQSAGKSTGAWTQAQKEQAMRERRAAAMAKKNKG